jgi:L-seryl-tRNA(Ser) seleniumtransferase
MGKSTGPAADSVAALRSIPSVERILSGQAFSRLAGEFGRERVKEALAIHLTALRSSSTEYDESKAVTALVTTLRNATQTTLRRVVNASGVLIHTNLGRAPVDPEAWQEGGSIAAGYTNLELDLGTGERGSRDEHLTELCRTLFGCESAILTNNNAAGTLLALAALAARKEVVVSRGELVEIGGGFRVPDVIQQGGAKLKEVGTTNRTRAADYAAAISRRTAAILRVHRSNFDLVGFTETPSLGELVEVARSRKVPLLFDEGSGCIVDLAPYGFAQASPIAEIIAAGVDLVMCSTDKLIGSVQGGLILGRAELIERCRRHPLMRALRAGKESYAVIGATLRAFATGAHEQRVPLYRMLSMTEDELRARGEQLIAGTGATIVQSRCALGGGTTPNETIGSLAIAVPGNAAALYSQFLTGDPPIIGRAKDGRFTLELRTILDDDVPAIRQALMSLQAQR